MSRLSSTSRLSLVGGVFACGFVVVLLHLWILMVQDREVWARRSYENRWAFRSVPSQRGALRDRFDRVLARDQATTKVSVFYLRFRLWNAIGAAVHGAIRWTDLRRGQPGVIYGYYEGQLGPTAAVQELLDMPVAVLKRGVLKKSDAAALLTCVKTVLAQCSGLSRSKVYTALRAAAESGQRICIGDVLDMPRGELLMAFDERLRALQELDRRIGEAQDRRADLLDIPREELPGLIETLETLRHASLQEERVTWTDENGELKTGSKKEEVLKEFAVDIEFELAAALRVDRHLYVGVQVHPAVTRVHNTEPGTSLRVLLGRVFDYDRTIGEGQEDTWFDAVAADMPENWLDELVPEGVVVGDDARERLQQSARRRYEREVLSRERRGVTGMEAAFDDELSGRLGMRFVEHDSKRREQLLWSHLRVERGEDTRLTIDLDLQNAAEQAVRYMYQHVLPQHDTEEARRRLETALAIIDAGTGDVLAYAGAPIVSENARDVPGVVWTGNAEVGSIIKPIVMVEHLESQKLGRPHQAQIEPCEGRKTFPDLRRRPFRCDDTHGSRGQDPVRVIAESCNVFFYQAGLGLGNAGLERALRRFGLLETPADDPFFACWQPRIRGLAAARPRMNPGRWLIQRSIGYGIQISPVHIARAYAGIATGALPTLGLQLHRERPRVSLMGFDDSLEIVREGLRECVLSGTARRLDNRLKDLELHAKTGTAEVGKRPGRENNAWFAGYLPWRSQSGVQIAFCAVAYWVPDGEHGADIAGNLFVDFLKQVEANPRLQQDYLTRENG